MLIWATGRVTRVADGLTDMRSARAKKLLPAGAVLWAWDADPEFVGDHGEVAAGSSGSPPAAKEVEPTSSDGAWLAL